MNAVPGVTPRLAIMQPYLFPYAGYFQLVAAVDRFVFYDDVNFIKGGWINRNRLLRQGAPAYFTIPLEGASPFMPIDRIETAPRERWLRKLLDSLRHAYGRAPHYEAVMPLVEAVLLPESRSIAGIAKRSVTLVSDYLGLRTAFVDSSRIFRNNALQGAARVLDICCQCGAREYLNLPGGASLYAATEFADRGMTLRFVPVSLVPYRQGAHAFVPGLSILDMLMFNDVPACRELIAAAPSPVAAAA
jgi:hypothetical protein